MEEITFLIVEDDTSQALFLESLLHESGYDKVRICQSGQEAILIVKNYSIDVVLMDIQLKGDLDGIQTAIEIDKIDLCKIIYITSLKDKRTFDRAKQTFPESFLSKPFNRYQLLDIIQTLIDSKQNTISKSAQRMSDFFFAKENQSDSYKKIAKSEISYLKADSSYTDVYINEKTLKVSKNLKHTLEDLNYDKLIRINRSVAINIDSIKSIEGSNSVYLFGINQSFVITKEFKEEFNNMINKL